MIEDLTKIKTEIINILTKNEITSNGFDPSSSAQKSQYAEMIMAALGLAVTVTGGKKTRKHRKYKKHNLKTKKYRKKNRKYMSKKRGSKNKKQKTKNKK